MIQDDCTLGEAREWTRRRAAEGVCCPLCRQTVKVYRRTLNGSMAKVLWEFFRWDLQNPGSFFHFAKVLNPIGYHGADYSKLSYWGLLETDPDQVGYWRITELGKQFAQAKSAVPSHAVVYDGRLLRLDGQAIKISDIHTKGFDYNELMAERPETQEPQ